MPTQATRERIRLRLDISSSVPLVDQLTGASPILWRGMDVEFEVALFYGDVLLDVTNLSSITLTVKPQTSRLGAALMAKAIASFTNTVTVDTWNAGTDQHGVIAFTSAETDLDLGGANQVDYWLFIWAVDNTGKKIPLGNSTLSVLEPGDQPHTPPAPGDPPLYYTATQSDARYVLKAGDTMTGTLVVPNLTITGLAGVLKATAGVVSGSATTSDLTEGTNLYYTQARFDAAFAAKSTTDLAEGTHLYYTDARADARIALQKGAANGLATLGAGGLIPSSQLPPVAITDTSVVASQAAMLAVTAEVGDVAVRTDLNKSFILRVADPTVLGHWQELLTPTDAVLSVNGQTGVVNLTTTDIAEGTNLYYTAARFNSAFAAKSTADLAEGSNLYYTDARVRACVLTGLNTSLTGDIAAADTILQAFGRAQNKLGLFPGAPVIGDILISSAGDVWDRLAGNTAATKKFLTQTGTGTGSAAAGWNTIASGDLAGVSTSALSEGSNLYYTDGRVRSCVLTGLSTATGGAIVATDSILAAFGRTENRLAALEGASGVITNSSSQTRGSGNPYTCTNAFAQVTFATGTNPTVALPSAGTYLITAVVVFDGQGEACRMGAKLYNSTDAVDVGEARYMVSKNTDVAEETALIVIQELLTVAAGKTIQIYGYDNAVTNHSTIPSAQTMISYVKLA